MAYRKTSNLIHLKLREICIKNVLLLRKQKKTMREIGKLVGKSRTEVQNIIDSSK
jgi:hypothetical protein